jgi:DNA-binding NtrC family response regulator
MSTLENSILIIETDLILRNNLAQHVRQEGFHVLVADKEREAAALLSKMTIPLVLLGLKGLKRRGIDILRMIRRRFPHVKVITINSGEQFELSLEVMRMGAFDDFLIPFELETLMARMHWAMAAADKGVTRNKRDRRTEQSGGEA